MEKKLTTKTSFGGFSTKNSSVQKSIRSGPMNERWFFDDKDFLPNEEG